jgi:hypothetical protein
MTTSSTSRFKLLREYKLGGRAKINFDELELQTSTQSHLRALVTVH